MCSHSNFNLFAVARSFSSSILYYCLRVKILFPFYFLYNFNPHINIKWGGRLPPKDKKGRQQINGHSINNSETSL